MTRKDLIDLEGRVAGAIPIDRPVLIKIRNAFLGSLGKYAFLEEIHKRSPKNATAYVSSKEESIDCVYVGAHIMAVQYYRMMGKTK